MANLTNKQRVFIDEYLVDHNATQAAIRAGYSEDSAKEIGYENLTKLHIQVAIQERMDARSKRTEITADKVLRELAKLGFSNMLDYITIEDGNPTVDLSAITEDQGAAISEFTIDTRYERGQGDVVATIEKVKFKLADKGINLERLGKHLKLFTDKHDINASGFTVVISDKDAAGL